MNIETINEIEKNISSIPKSFVGNGIDINKIMEIHNKATKNIQNNKKCYEITTHDDILLINIIIMQNLTENGKITICIKD